LPGCVPTSRATHCTHVVLSLVLLAAACVTSDAAAQRSAPPVPAHRVGVMVGGSLNGRVQQRIDGHSVTSVDGETLDGAADLRSYASWFVRRWFVLSGYGGVTNWQSGYLTSAGHHRSNFFPLGLGAEVRIPFGRCRRCPSLFLGEWASVVISQRDQRAPYLRVEEHGSFGVGGSWSFAGALDIPFRGRFGLRMQVAWERTILRHWVELSGVGTQRERYDLQRSSVMLGPWMAL